VGLDGLKDTVLKRLGNTEQLIHKLQATFNHWIATGKMPKYMTQTRMVALSKSHSPYPEVGDIRTLAISPAISKVLEKAIVKRLNDYINDQNLLHHSQSGFVKGKSTLHNIQAVINWIQKTKTQQQTDRDKKIPASKRQLKALIFIDLRKAFDRVNR
jgi:hypothetical protein